MHIHDDKYPSRPGFEPGTPRLQAPVDTNEPSVPAAADVRLIGVHRSAAVAVYAAIILQMWLNVISHR